MLLAYLRGLLRPDYKQGMRSKVREEVILAALDKEQRAKYSADLIALEGSILSSLKPEATRTHYRKLNEAVLQVANLREFLEAENDNVSNLSSIDASVKLYHALEKAGILS